MDIGEESVHLVIDNQSGKEIAFAVTQEDNLFVLRIEMFVDLEVSSISI